MVAVAGTAIDGVVSCIAPPTIVVVIITFFLARGTKHFGSRAPRLGVGVKRFGVGPAPTASPAGAVRTGMSNLPRRPIVLHRGSDGGEGLHAVMGVAGSRGPIGGGGAGGAVAAVAVGAVGAHTGAAGVSGSGGAAPGPRRELVMVPAANDATLCRGPAAGGVGGGGVGGGGWGGRRGFVGGGRVAVGVRVGLLLHAVDRCHALRVLHAQEKDMSASVRRLCGVTQSGLVHANHIFFQLVKSNSAATQLELC